MLSRAILSSTVLLAGNAAAANFLSNGLAVTPQMGWNTWNTFACDVDEDLLLSTARTLVDLGFRDAGYHYLVLDDCWSDGRTANGTLQPDATKFPNGMKYIADHIHTLGMGFGMYSDAGAYTCGMYAGSLGHETTDAKTFASWGVDYLKYDNCYNQGQSGTPQITYGRYKTMSDALNATGRPILYSMCNWGEDGPWNWAQTMANSWRMSGDIYDSFNTPDIRCPCTDAYDCLLPGYHCSVMNILNKQAAFPSKSQPGAWSDLDMLEIGNGRMNDDEYKLHMTMWAATKSPLIIGADVRSLDANAYSIYTNPAVLAISQDPTGSSIVRHWRYFVDPDDNGQGEISMWSGTLSQGDYILVLLNAANSSMSMNATLADIFIDNGGAKSTEAQQSWDLYDIWGNRIPNSTANLILDSNSTMAAMNITSYYWNATETSFADGIAANNSLLLGTKVGSVAALGTVMADVPRHGVVAYRMRPNGAPATRKRDEL
ncbi:alpha-galactosidase/alpha-n-acetylgalactosaminidase [Delphinella strobiligena]|nr:alpha-galactosidase/alpha-n-acetylgalactosaminidase [Delphinella strobiligena]